MKYTKHIIGSALTVAMITTMTFGVNASTQYENAKKYYTNKYSDYNVKFNYMENKNLLSVDIYNLDDTGYQTLLVRLDDEDKTSKDTKKDNDVIDSIIKNKTYNPVPAKYKHVTDYYTKKYSGYTVKFNYIEDKNLLSIDIYNIDSGYKTLLVRLDDEDKTSKDTKKDNDVIDSIIKNKTYNPVPTKYKHVTDYYIKKYSGYTVKFNYIEDKNLLSIDIYNIDSGYKTLLVRLD